MKKFLRKEKFNIGLVLMLNAMCLSNIVSFMLKKDMSVLSSVFLVVSLLCIVDVKNLFSFKLYKKSKEFHMILYMSIYILIYSIVDKLLFAGTGETIIYNLFVVIAALTIMTNREWKNKTSFVKILFFFSGFVSIVSAFVLSQGFTDFVSGFNGLYENDNLIVDRLTIVVGSFYFCLALMVYKPERKGEHIFRIVGIICAAICFIITNRRAKIAEIFLCIFFLVLSSYLRNRTIKVSKLKKIGYFIIPLGMILVWGLSNEWLVANIQRIFDSMKRAVGTLFGNTRSYGFDESASIRFGLRKQIISEYMQYSILEMFFGKGYMYKYLDFPIMQAFIDMGIFVGIVYAFVTIILPIKWIFKKPSGNEEILFQLLLICSVFDQFYNGVPYGLDRFLILFLAALCFKKKSMAYH